MMYAATEQVPHTVWRNAELIDIIMQEQQLRVPSTALEARNLFMDLVYHIDNS